MTIIQEGKHSFNFSNDWEVACKFDDEVDYKKVCNIVSSTKAVDIIAKNAQLKQICLIEIKDFAEHEADACTKNRLAHDCEDLSMEIAQKVRDSLSCMLAGARNSTNKRDTWSKFCSSIIDKTWEIKVIAWTNEPIHQTTYTEYDWKARQTHRNDKLKKKLKWLTTKAVYSNKRDNVLKTIGITVTP